MRDLAATGSRTPEIESLAVQIGDPFTLENWIRQVWVFVPDPDFAEYVKSPTLQIQEALDRYAHTGQLHFTGDCDDAATLAASILSALQYPNWLTAIRLPGNPEFEHVYTTALVGDFELAIDPVVPREQMPIQNVEEVMEVDVWPTVI